MYATMVGGFYIVLHISYIERLLSGKLVFLDDVIDFFALIPDTKVGVFEVRLHFCIGRLGGEIVCIHRAEDEAPDIFRFAKVKKLDGVGQSQHIAADLAEIPVEPFFQLFKRDVGNVAIVKVGERKLELGTELVERQGRRTSLFEDVVGRLPYPGQVVHKRAGPVEYDIPNHGGAPYTSCRGEVSFNS